MKLSTNGRQQRDPATLQVPIRPSVFSPRDSWIKRRIPSRIEMGRVMLIAEAADLVIQVFPLVPAPGTSTATPSSIQLEMVSAND